MKIIYSFSSIADLISCCKGPSSPSSQRHENITTTVSAPSPLSRIHSRMDEQTSVSEAHLPDELVSPAFRNRSKRKGRPPDAVRLLIWMPFARLQDSSEPVTIHQ